MNSAGSTIDTERAARLQRELGPVPSPIVTKPNPAYEQWVGRAALRLCLAADECGVIPTPCANHLIEARKYAAHLLQRPTNGAA